MRALPSSLPGPDNDLSDQLEHFIKRAIQEPDATVYAFGQRWGPEPQTRDKIFNFLPGLGIHDIHMNQGNVPPFLGDDGVWQDGGLVLQFPSTQQWVALFLAFQSQAWHTDDTTGHTSSDTPPDSGEPDNVVRIVGALVNPMGPAPEHETVTISMLRRARSIWPAGRSPTSRSTSTTCRARSTPERRWLSRCRPLCSLTREE